jgi:hypothetical protein
MKKHKHCPVYMWRDWRSTSTDQVTSWGTEGAHTLHSLQSWVYEEVQALLRLHLEGLKEHTHWPGYICRDWRGTSTCQVTSGGTEEAQALPRLHLTGLKNYKHCLGNIWNDWRSTSIAQSLYCSVPCDSFSY